MNEIYPTPTHKSQIDTFLQMLIKKVFQQTHISLQTLEAEQAAAKQAAKKAAEQAEAKQAAKKAAAKQAAEAAKKAAEAEKENIKTFLRLRHLLVNSPAQNNSIKSLPQNWKEKVIQRKNQILANKKSGAKDRNYSEYFSHLLGKLSQRQIQLIVNELYKE